METLWETVEALGLVEVFATGQYDYEWSEFKAWRHPSGRFYWFHDAGCSCSEFGDGYHSAADLGDGDRDALERALRAWHADNSYGCPDEVIVECVEKLRRLPH